MQKKRILSAEHKRKIGESNKKAHPMKLYTFICKNCGESFTVRYKNRIYCSQECYQNKKLFNLECVLCDEIFISKVKNTKFCDICKVGECKICGKQFIRINGKDMGFKKYCSQECFHKAIIGKVACNKEEGVDVICAICGKQFNVWKSRMRRDVKYCSRECKYEGQSRVTNVNHPLWKGGHSLYAKLLSENEGSFYRNRRIVLERDDNTCQYCGFKGESNYMDVHHIITVIKGGTNLPENMVTLCRKCHNNADRCYISVNLLKEKVLELY